MILTVYFIISGTLIGSNSAKCVVMIFTKQYINASIPKNKTHNMKWEKTGMPYFTMARPSDLVKCRAGMQIYFLSSCGVRGST